MTAHHRVEHVLPASNRRFIQKAAESAADVLVLDLEDAVAASVKAPTRQVLIDAVNVTDFHGKKVLVRPNNLRTKWAAGDYYTVIRAVSDKITGVALPKVEGAHDIETVDSLLTAIEQEKGWPSGRLKIEALIELPGALIAVEDIAGAIAESGRGGALIFGLVDYLAATGGRPEAQEAPFLYPIYAKQRILNAARKAGIEAVDGISIHIKDYEKTKADALQSAKIGFTGKWSLHPEQIRAIRDADREQPFAPSRAYRADQKPQRSAAPFPLERLKELAEAEQPILAPEPATPHRTRARRSLLRVDPENTVALKAAFDSPADEIVLAPRNERTAGRIAGWERALAQIVRTYARGRNKRIALLCRADRLEKDSAERALLEALGDAAGQETLVHSVQVMGIERPEQVQDLDRRLTEIEKTAPWGQSPESALGLEIRVESMKALEAAARLATASARVECLMAALSEADDDFYVKGALLAAAAAGGIDAIAGLNAKSASVEKDAYHAVVMGYSGKLIERPDEASAVNRIFSPPPELIARALEIVERYRKADVERGLGAIVYRDPRRPDAPEELVDAATVKVECRVLALAAAARLFTPAQAVWHQAIMSWGPGAAGRTEPFDESCANAETSSSGIRRVSILGAGEIGAPLAARMARCGIKVALGTLHLDTLAKAEKKIFGSLEYRTREAVGLTARPMERSDAPADERAALEAEVEGLKKKAAAQQEEWEQNVKTHQDTNYIDLITFLNEEPPDLIIESVREEILTKQAVLHAWMERIKQNDPLPILATTTSSLSVAEIGRQLPEPLRRRLIGFHPFNPPDQVDLVEIAYTPETDPEVTQRAAEFAKSLGMQPILVKDSCGFIVNHLLFVYLNEAMHLLENGEASLEQIATAMLDFGFPMDPFGLTDFIRLDVAEAVIENLHRTSGHYLRPPSRLLKQLLGHERYGKRTGRGFYSYVPLKPLSQSERERLAEALRVETADIDRILALGLNPTAETVALLKDLGIDKEGQERLLTLFRRYPEQPVTLDEEGLEIYRKLGIKVTGMVGEFDFTRLPLLMANEAARLAEADIASVADIDMAMDLGTRFPEAQGAGVRFDGGIFAVTRAATEQALKPMYPRHEIPKKFNAGPFGWLLRYGIENATGELEALARHAGPRYAPAPLLKQLSYGQIPRRHPDGTFPYIKYKRVSVKPRGVRGPADQVLEEGIVRTEPQLGSYQIRARVLVGDINANWKWGVRDYPIDIARYHRETATVGGSAGLVMVTEVGQELAGQIQPGEIGIMLSGKHDVLTTEALGGSAQAHRSFRIHAYEAKDALEGSHSQEVVLDWLQFVKVDEGAYPLETLGGLGLVYPTVEHAWNVLNLKKDQWVGVEGAIGGTGGPGVQTAKFRDARVIGIVSSAERGQIAKAVYGADDFIDRTRHLSDEAYVSAVKDAVRGLTGHKRLLDKILAYSGQGLFRKHFLSLREADPMSREDFGGEIAYFGAGETGFALDIPGTSGDTPLEEMFERVSKLRRERYRVPRMRRLLLVGRADGELREAIMLAKRRHSDVIVVALNRADAEAVKGWDLLATQGPWSGRRTQDGLIDSEALGIAFERMPDPPMLLPDRPTDTQVQEFNQRAEAYASYQRRRLIPFGKAIGAIWGADSTGRPLSPDVDMVLVGGAEGENVLNYLMFTAFFTQIAYPNDTSRMALRWHAALGWMNQNSLLLTRKTVLGAHYASPAESAAVIDWVMRGAIRPPTPTWWPIGKIGQAQEAIGAGKNVVLIGVPRPGLKRIDEAYQAQEVAPMVARLAYPKTSVREWAAEGLYVKGSAMVAQVQALWSRDERWRTLIMGPPTVGIAVEPDRFQAIRAAWDHPPLSNVPPEQDTEEFEIVRHGVYLDILAPKRSGPEPGPIDKFLARQGEGIQQVELLTSDVELVTRILTARAQQTGGPKPIYTAPRAGANGTRVNFILMPLADGGKLLVEFVEWVGGARALGHPRIITDRDVRLFAKYSGDRNPFHLDEDYGQKSRYGARIAHGMLTAGIVIAELAHLTGGYVIERIEITRFIAAVRIGDRISPYAEFLESNPDRLRLRIGACRGGETLFEGYVAARRRSAPGERPAVHGEMEPSRVPRWVEQWVRDVEAFAVHPAPDFQIGDRRQYSGDQAESAALRVSEDGLRAAGALFGPDNPHLPTLMSLGPLAHTSALFAPGYILLGATAHGFGRAVEPGDILTSQATVNAMSRTSAGKVIATIGIKVTNQKGEPMVSGEVTKLKAD